MSKLDTLKAAVAGAAGATPAAVAAACAAVDAMSKTDPRLLAHVSHQSLASMAKSAGVAPDTGAAAILVGVGALTEFGFLNDGDGEHYVSAEDLAEARREGSLVHPESGEEIPDFENAIAHVFAVGPALLALQDEVGPRRGATVGDLRRAMAALPDEALVLFDGPNGYQVVSSPTVATVAAQGVRWEPAAVGRDALVVASGR